MRRHQSARDYEVYCPRCRVTFPIGAKKCLHCGGRVGPRDDWGQMVRSREGGGLKVPGEVGAQTFESEAADADELEGRSALRSPITMLWIFLALATAVYRACTGGA